MGKLPFSKTEVTTKRMKTDMAAATAARPAEFMRPEAHPPPRRDDGSGMCGAEQRQHEKDFIAKFSDQQRPLQPGEIVAEGRRKELGGSSRALSVDDFELVKTLGTGRCKVSYKGWSPSGRMSDVRWTCRLTLKMKSAGTGNAKDGWTCKTWC